MRLLYAVSTHHDIESNKKLGNDSIIDGNNTGSNTLPGYLSSLPA